MLPSVFVLTRPEFALKNHRPLFLWRCDQHVCRRASLGIRHTTIPPTPRKNGERGGRKFGEPISARPIVFVPVKLRIPIAIMLGIVTDSSVTN
jgi:hypothetical protein